MALLSELLSELSLSRVLLGVLIFVVTFAVSIVAVSYILINLPSSYFQESHPKEFWTNRHPSIRVTGLILKNILGVILVVLGVLMSLPGVPGQGVLTILLGIMLLDFPGKQRFEHWIVSRPKVLKTINRLRHKFGRAELIID